jgi:2-polyprenyl-3-methyl-5-hydroxy-6-metoxy-1,4-benzoquinol methylase
MMRMLKYQIQGFMYLFSHPSQLKHIIIRESRYRQRRLNKKMWVEWQKYSTYMAEIQLTPEAYAYPFNIERIRTISSMISSIGNGLMVLDVGCGDGVMSAQFSKMGNYVTSVDLPTITKAAHHRQVSSVVAGDAEQLAFASKTFDVVVASEMVEHLWNPNNFFDEVNRVLRSNGHLIIETPEGHKSLRYDDHKYYFTADILRQMLSKRFNVREVKRITPADLPTSTIILLTDKIVNEEK